MVADLEPFKHWHQKLQAEYDFLTKHSTEVQQQLDTLLKENRALVAGVQQVVLLAVGCQLARPFRLLCFILFTAGEKYEISASVQKEIFFAISSSCLCPAIYGENKQRYRHISFLP